MYFSFQTIFLSQNNPFQAFLVPETFIFIHVKKCVAWGGGLKPLVDAKNASLIGSQNYRIHTYILKNNKLQNI